MSAEKLSVDEAVQRIHDICVMNTQRLMKLEEQFNQMTESIAQRNAKIDTEIVKIEREISEMNMETTSKLKEDKQKFDEIKQQSGEIMQLLHTLLGKEHDAAENIHDTPKMVTKNCSSSNRPGLHIGDYSNYSKKVEPIHPINDDKTTKSCKVIAQKSIVPPIFSGTYSECPNEFLIHIQEYSEAVNGWDQTTLLRSISEFLRDTALDWYCHLRASHRCPRIWSDFVTLFLSRFDAPIEIARRQREWHHCKQIDSESIDEFFLRLRILWIEQKPRESESDFIQHFLCKIRSDIFGMMKVSVAASIEDVLLEAQRVEKVLQCGKEEKLKQVGSDKREDLVTYRVCDQNFINGYTSQHLLNSEHSCNAEGSFYQSKSFDNNRWDSQASNTTDYSKNGHRVSGKQDPDARS